MIPCDQILDHPRAYLFSQREFAEQKLVPLNVPNNLSSARLARQLALWDRGKFVRPLDEWKGIFSDTFEPVVFEPFWLTRLGVKLWNMVYFKGKARS